MQSLRCSCRSRWGSFAAGDCATSRSGCATLEAASFFSVKSTQMKQMKCACRGGCRGFKSWSKIEAGSGSLSMIKAKNRLSRWKENKPTRTTKNKSGRNVHSALYFIVCTKWQKTFGEEGNKKWMKKSSNKNQNLKKENNLSNSLNS